MFELSEEYELLSCLGRLGQLISVPEAGRKYAEIMNSGILKIPQSLRAVFFGRPKSGRSYLINSVIGAAVMPSDEVPSAPVTVRTGYTDTEKRITLREQSGSTRNITALEYRDIMRSEDTHDIAEIIVNYPSVFGLEGIELTELPGFPDADAVQDFDFNSLRGMYAAVIAIPADEKPGDTEKALVEKLTGSTDVSRIFFAVTRMDKVGGDDQIRANRTAEINEFISKLASPPARREPLGIREVRAPGLRGALAAKLAQEKTPEKKTVKMDVYNTPKLRYALCAAAKEKRRLALIKTAREHIKKISANIGRWCEVDISIAAREGTEKGRNRLGQLFYVKETYPELLRGTEELLDKLAAAAEKIPANISSFDADYPEFISAAVPQEKSDKNVPAGIPEAAEYSDAGNPGTAEAPPAWYTDMLWCADEMKKMCKSPEIAGQLSLINLGRSENADLIGAQTKLKQICIKMIAGVSDDAKKPGEYDKRMSALTEVGRKLDGILFEILEA